MKLTDHEKKMLDGAFGRGPQDAMQLLITLGTVYDAERMIPVTTCHLGGRNVLLGGRKILTG
jgi:predicted aconitase